MAIPIAIILAYLAIVGIVILALRRCTRKEPDRQSKYNCAGCDYLIGRSCILISGNHCIRRAEDYYKKTI
jgi:nitrate reductase gamma subunit